jgi:hypothetical protein
MKKYIIHAMPEIGPIKAMTRTMELEHLNFICPNLKDYWQRKVNKDRTDLQCTDINDPRYQPKLYSGQPEDFPGSAPARSPATALTDYHQREPAARSSSTAVSVSHQQRKPPADTATLREHRLRFFFKSTTTTGQSSSASIEKRCCFCNFSSSKEATKDAAVRDRRDRSYIGKLDMFSKFDNTNTLICGMCAPLRDRW